MSNGDFSDFSSSAVFPSLPLSLDFLSLSHFLFPQSGPPFLSLSLALHFLRSLILLFPSLTHSYPSLSASHSFSLSVFAPLLPFFSAIRFLIDLIGFFPATLKKGQKAKQKGLFKITLFTFSIDAAAEPKSYGRGKMKRWLLLLFGSTCSFLHIVCLTLIKVVIDKQIHIAIVWHFCCSCFYIFYALFLSCECLFGLYCVRFHFNR